MSDWDVKYSVVGNGFVRVKIFAKMDVPVHHLDKSESDVPMNVS